MNRDQAYNLIRQTFTQGFDKARFGNFAINLLNRMDESKTSAWKGPYIKDAFKDHVNYYERLGTFTSPDNEKLDVLIVHLTTESKLEHARTAIRNFVADHLKTRDEKDAALVAFVSPTEKHWRFSYVKMEYATVEKESGKVGVKTRLTPARRFSYIVGEGESCHTAQTRFLGLLQDTQTDPKLADIEEAFSVEAVTKEFYKKYRALFEEIEKELKGLVAKEKVIQKEFETKNIKPEDFAKKLMGQIVFLYFLQKKGWLGVAKGLDWGSGPHDFLRRLEKTEYGKYDNFFNDILEPLFYNTLATDRGHEAWCNRFQCRIPFLNGGLFEPLGGYDWERIDILLPNRLFTNTDFVEEGITGTGVLDVFDRYNFTVNEAEPLEKEVAIDPEMLGKVFENLIEENRRKGLGAYYTPREIVHYMCQESLINYLDTAVNKVAQASSLRTTGEHDDRATIFFDPDALQEISERNLPHWRQSGTTYYVTFRLADSLPQEKLQQLTLEREAWLKSHPEPRSPSVTAEYHRLFSEKVEQWLDAGAGSCVLREPDAAKIVADALKHFDGERYMLSEWVVMPNHVHVLVTPLHEHKLSDILHTWKSFTANKINELFHRTGTLWQHESYDHIVRSDDQLHRIGQYIRNNPSKAGINVTQASSLQSRAIDKVEQASSLDNHKQDACATLIPRKDIETFVHLGDQAAHYEAARMSGTKSYKPELSKGIEEHARLIDEKLADITVCDPAVGSGAFLVGMMTEIVRARTALTPYFNDVHERTPYYFKRHAIQNCLYGVDIDLGAVEIAKLRLWLSLVVDEEDVKQIKPLPNLDYKVVAGNSLLGFPFKSQRLSEIEVLKQQFFDETDHEKKAMLKSQIDQQLREAFAASKQSLGYQVNFDFEIYFSEVFHPRKGGFDVTIGNPPYVRADEKSDRNRSLREQILASKSYETLWEKWDLFVPFIEKSYKVLKPRGTTSLIVSDAFCHSKYAQKPQKWFLENARILRLDFCSDLKIFDAAVHNIIYFFQKADGTHHMPERRVHRETFGNVTTLPSDEQAKLTYRAFFPEEKAHQTFSCKTLQLDSICYISVGMVINADEKSAKGAFLTGELISPVKDKLHPKAFVEGKNLTKWIFSENSWLEWGTSRAPHQFRRQTFPELYEHSEKLMLPMVGEVRGAIDTERFYCNHGIFVSVPWHQLNGVKNLSLKKAARYQGEKPPRPDLPKREELEATSRRFAVKYLLGVINSSPARDFLRANRRNNVQLYPDDWKKLSIPDVSPTEQAKVVALVDRILAAKRQDANADIAFWEREIDRLVYELYGLTEEEIAIVEGTAK